MLEFREALRIYKENIYKILILGLTIMLPVQILLTLSSDFLISI
ncbi:hypothetical protein JOD24_003173 [Kroppenstedtia sanguinis]